MGISVQILTYDRANAGQITLDKFPDDCPFCHKGIQPIFDGHPTLIDDTRVEVVLRCSRRECQRTFVAYYERSPSSPTGQLRGVSHGTVKTIEFSDAVKSTSPAFVKIYQEAFTAEQQSLLEICGVGYRKALEFLVKDYAISKKSEDATAIKKTVLGNVIANFIEDRRIKAVPARAAWLGNDETHYVRLWEGRDLEDLKALIRLTIHWIEMEVETQRFEIEMPNPKRT